MNITIIGRPNEVFLWGYCFDEDELSLGIKDPATQFVLKDACADVSKIMHLLRYISTIPPLDYSFVPFVLGGQRINHFWNLYINAYLSRSSLLFLLHL